MSQSLLQSVEESFLKQTPDIKTGYTVKVYQKIKEGEKERVQIFEGLVIGVSGRKGTNQTFIVRKVVSGVGVEKIFPLHSSNIEKIEVVKFAKIRRAKLYYMRDRSGKSARLKETYIDGEHEINSANKLKKEVASIEEVTEATETESPTVVDAIDETVTETPTVDATPEVVETPETEAPVVDTKEEAAKEEPKS